MRVDRDGELSARLHRADRAHLDPPTAPASTRPASGCSAPRPTTTSLTQRRRDRLRPDQGRQHRARRLRRHARAVDGAGRRSMLTVGQTVAVAVTAIDQAQNRATATATFRAIADAAPPQVAITAHRSGANVPRPASSSGTATDDMACAAWSPRSTTRSSAGPSTRRSTSPGTARGARGAERPGQRGPARHAEPHRSGRQGQPHDGQRRCSGGGGRLLAHTCSTASPSARLPPCSPRSSAIGVDAFVSPAAQPGGDRRLGIRRPARRPAAPTTKAELQTPGVRCAPSHSRDSCARCSPVLGQPLQHRRQQAPGVDYELAENTALPGPRPRAASATCSTPAPRARRCCIYLDNAMSRGGDAERELRPRAARAA